ncbi:MAG: chemotaxis protein CheW [Alphaproteobacteria bacterium]
MDDLLSEFLTETAESLDVVDVELVKFESDPQNTEVLDRVFRLVHTIKGTCGFLGLPRLEAVAHAAETMLGRFRDGQLTVTPESVTLILESLDHIKVLLQHLEAEEREPDGNDSELIGRLETAAAGGATLAHTGAAPAIETSRDAAPVSADGPVDSTLGRPLTAGEVTLEELERAFNETQSDVTPEPVPASAPPAEGKSADAAPVAPQESDDGAKTEGGRSPETSIANQSIRVNVDVLENLMTMVSELVLTRNQLMEMVRHLDDSEFKVPLQRLSNVTGELQEEVMKTRMQPIGNAWQKLPRIIRDLSRDLDKKIHLEMIGADTELDRQVLEMIKDPLTHMVRNSADHGLERTEDRRAAGKSEVGTVTLKAYHEGGHIIIEVGDDGRGLDIEKIKAKAIANGLATDTAIEGMSEAQIQKFIFHPGFSTAAAITNVSGRGVGMDVVRSNIELIGGSIDLKSIFGQGTVFTIKIPLTLAIVSALIVEAAGQRFAVPQLSVVELVRISSGSEHTIERINNTPVLRLRDRLLPLIYLGEELGIEAEKDRKSKDAFVIVSQVGAQIFGVVVDGVFDTEEIVVKPVATILRDITMFSGNTILGDGSVIMIMDPNGVAQRISSEQSTAKDTKSGTKRSIADADQPVTMLIFRAGSKEPKAVPLSLVTRLEEIEADKIEPSNGQNLVQYRGRLMPIMHVNPGHALNSEGRQPILVFTDGDRSLGLAVDEIVDIVEDKLNIELAADRPGMLGSAVIKGRATEVLDISYHLTQVFRDWFERADTPSIALRKRQVLLVDDSAFFRNLITPLLNAAGYAVTSVASVEEAWRYREAGIVFDAIVSDIEMPGTDGFEFARQVQADDSWSRIPILALSSFDGPDERKRGEEVGFRDYVSKSDRQSIVNALRVAVVEQGEAA